MNCIAIDDEPLALEMLQELIGKIPFLKLEASCKSGIEALNVLNERKIDLIFLDIQMPDLSGIQLLKSLKNPPLVIFTTAYENYALESYSLDPIDYLLKPIPFERFLKAVNKAQEYFNYKNKPVSATQTDNFMFVRADYKIIKINFADILYLEGWKDYIKIFLVGEPRPILTLQSLKSMEEKLPSSDFMRVHRSFIVSLKRINSIQKNKIKISEFEIPIGDLFREQFFATINEKTE